MANLVDQYPTLPQPDKGPHQQFLYALVAALVRVIRDWSDRLNDMLPLDGSEAMTAPLKLMTYTLTPDTRPSASDWTGGIIYVSDGGAGNVFQGASGGSWVSLG